MTQIIRDKQTIRSFIRSINGLINPIHMAVALLVMDFELAMIGRLQQPDTLLTNVQATITAARSAGVPVVYVAVRFREGYPEVSPANKFFSGLINGGSRLQETDESSSIHPAVAPQPGDVLVIKRRISAFTGSDLEVVLRAGRLDHLVLCGISTSGVVLSTVREAGDKDFQLTVLGDCCADADEDLHQVLLTKVFPRQAAVLDHQAWIHQLQHSRL